MSDNTILELQNVSLTFGGLKAVSDVNFKMKNNEIVTTETIDKLCDYLRCQPEEILEFIPNEKEHI